MNTHVCFILLLAVGLSVQKSEFQIDFEDLVKTVNLLNCPQSCTVEVKEAKCKCRRFPCSERTPVIDCIKNGLDNLKLANTGNIIARLKDLNITSKNHYDNSTLISPKAFLDIIKTLYQEENASKSDRY